MPPFGAPPSETIRPFCNPAAPPRNLRLARVLLVRTPISYIDLMKEFTGRTAFITGASGIGGAAAHALARAGARVAVLSRSEDELEALTADIEAQGGIALAVPGDVSEPASIQAAIEQVAQAWGRLDIVFANAGINGTWAPIEELTVDDWQQVISINLSGTFYTIKFATPFLKRQGGSIIITSSVNGTRMFSNTGATPYVATKAAQLAMGQLLALELAPFKVRVNIICPGAIETSIGDNTNTEDLDHIRYPVSFPKGTIPLTGGAAGSAEQVAELVLFLASDRASHITGTPIWIDGAQSLLLG